jgi:PAS domain S-box-containing protein
MFLASWLAILGPTFVIGISVLVFGVQASWFPDDGMPLDQMGAIWDEGVIVFLGLIGLALLRIPGIHRWGRVIIPGYLTIMFAVSVIDHIWTRLPTDATLLVPYILLMLVGVGTMPFRPKQAFACGVSLMLGGALAAGVLTPALNLGMALFPPEGYIMMMMITLFCVGISAVLYAGRWRQYVAGKQIEASEREFRSLFENANDSIFVIDNTTGRFSHVNPVLTELVGVPAAELYQMPFWEMIDPSDRERVIGYHRTRLEGGAAPSRYTLKIMSRKSPEPIICDLTIHRTDDPRFTRGALRDISDQVRAEGKIRSYAKELELTNRELRETQAQLVQSEKMAALGNLVAGVAHEINTPVGSIHANADVSRRALELIHAALEPKDGEPSLDQAKIRRAIDILTEANTTTCTATERIVRIVKSLRNFARLDEAEVKTVDIHEGLESTLTLVYHEYKRHIEVIREYGDLPKIACYPNQINQVFMNILVNAIHAIPDKGTITIRTRSLGDKVQVIFTDTGKGIPEENLEKIFDPGFTTKGVGVGTGLGLSIVYKIVQAHRGKIAVESTVGTGTTFTLTLPVDGLDTESRNNTGDRSM